MSWQHQLTNAITDPKEFFERLKLPSELLPPAILASKSFALRVPEPYLDRMEPGNIKDPLLLQVLPLLAETQPVPGYVIDPLGEESTNHQPGIIHKYHGRVLLIISGGCAINCRYCFRRHFPYSDNQLGTEEWQQALDYLNRDHSISEVILSGGDPLAANDKRLNKMFQDLGAIPHLKRLRIHTRLPVVIPQRVNSALIEAIGQSNLQTVIVTHINHPNEIDTELASAISKLKQAGVTLLNQSVLLKDINDHSDTLAMLSEKLFEIGLLPYYLHLLDPVAGASHFNVDENTARYLAGSLCDRLPGYLVPKLVREQAGATAKVPLMPILGKEC
ncbi:EF-P beta-lysylation protein EpmB [Motiliproteus sp. MSK22-1]|nr:EF-P beta-lysylation protein EpmB [Motiliproteus sp. MSK22-1]OMH38373.1 EF-P beta-lysylation protein EpmB [Motiliproteus sp. MSK22-1]